MMKQREKKKNIFVALLCMISLLAQSFGGFATVSKAAEATDTGYTTYTFSDLGIADGTYTKTESKQWKYGFNKVALVGDVTFPKDETTYGLYFSKGTSAYQGIHFRTYGDAVFVEPSQVGGTGFSISKTRLGVDTVANATIRMQIMFDTDATAQTVTMTLKLNNYEIAKTYAQDKMEALKYFIIYANSSNPMKVASVKNTPETDPLAGYEVKTFSDLGIADGIYTSMKKYAWSYGFNKVALTGYITLSNAQSDNGISFTKYTNDMSGYNGVKIRTYDAIMFGTDKGFTTISAKKFNATSIVGEAIKMLITFDTDTSTQKTTVKLTLNDTLVATREYDAATMATYDSFYIMGYKNGSVTVKSMEKDPLEGYDVKTFSDLGIADGTYTSMKKYAWSYGFNKVAFTGYITLSNAQSDNGISFTKYTNDMSGYNGVKIRTYDAIMFGTDKGFTTISAKKFNATSIVEEAIKMLITFDTDTSTQKTTVKLTLNDTLVATREYDAATMATYDSFYIMGYKNGSVTVKSIVPDSEDSTTNPTEGYTTYTFSDLGIEDGKYTASRACEWNYGSNKVAFAGEVTFHNDSPAGLCFDNDTANWNGLWISTGVNPNGLNPITIDSAVLGGGVYIVNAFDGTYKVVTAEQMGLAAYKDVPIKVYVLFDTNEAGDKVDVTYILNDYKETIQYDKSVIDGIKYLRMRAAETAPVSVTSIGGGTVTPPSGGGQDPETPTPPTPSTPAPPVEQINLDNYKKYTFVDFGIYDGTYKTNTTKSWKHGYDKVAFVTEITFPSKETTSGITFAPSAGNWNGLSIRTWNGALFFSHAGGGGDKVLSVKKYGVEDIAGTSIKLALAFDTYTDSNVVRMTVILNDQQVAAYDYPADKTAAYKTLVLRGSKTAPITVKSVQDHVEADTTVYKEYTFTDMGIYKSTYTSSQIKKWTYGYDGVVFNGLITFSEGNTSGGIYWGLSEGNWTGIDITGRGNQLIISNGLGGAVLTVPCANFGVERLPGTEIKLRVSFRKLDDTTTRMMVVVNDSYTTHVDYLTEKLETLKVFVMRADKKAPVTIASVGGTKVDRDIMAAWRDFLDTDVNLEYFGFSNKNWKAELAEINK